jgi:2-oxoglutarate ferredoxin oxidoreductase subunit gamma
MSRTEITIAGVGGQGSILAGDILGSAAVSHAGLFAVKTQAYSSELRGGFAAAWVVVSDEPVVYPRVTAPDILVAQAQDAIDRFVGTLRPGGVLIIDSDRIASPPEGPWRVFGIPATSISRNDVGLSITANIVMLGALWEVSRLIPSEAFEAAISSAVPAGKDRINLEAFALGVKQVKLFSSCE